MLYFNTNVGATLIRKRLGTITAAGMHQHANPF